MQLIIGLIISILISVDIEIPDSTPEREQVPQTVRQDYTPQINIRVEESIFEVALPIEVHDYLAFSEGLSFRFDWSVNSLLSEWASVQGYSNPVWDSDSMRIVEGKSYPGRSLVFHEQARMDTVFVIGAFDFGGIYSDAVCIHLRQDSDKFFQIKFDRDTKSITYLRCSDGDTLEISLGSGLPIDTDQTFFLGFGKSGDKFIFLARNSEEDSEWWTASFRESIGFEYDSLFAGIGLEYQGTSCSELLIIGSEVEIRPDSQLMEDVNTEDVLVVTLEPVRHSPRDMSFTFIGQDKILAGISYTNCLSNFSDVVSSNIGIEASYVPARMVEVGLNYQILSLGENAFVSGAGSLHKLGFMTALRSPVFMGCLLRGGIGYSIPVISDNPVLKKENEGFDDVLNSSIDYVFGADIRVLQDGFVESLFVRATYRMMGRMSAAGFGIGVIAGF